MCSFPPQYSRFACASSVTSQRRCFEFLNDFKCGEMQQLISLRWHSKQFTHAIHDSLMRLLRHLRILTRSYACEATIFSIILSNSTFKALKLSTSIQRNVPISRFAMRIRNQNISKGLCLMRILRIEVKTCRKCMITLPSNKKPAADDEDRFSVTNF